ncbi:MAG: NADPH:quinone oxidoreductase family protein [Acidimicrobiales bacterium]|nr:NADPH:quinone oxidoreductase family protein [Acidimicrobiales bacterium]
MKAWMVELHGEPLEALALREVADPEARPGTNTVVIDVEACGLNFADILLCRGTYQERPTPPFTPGLEVAGTVVAADPSCQLGPGQRVVGSPLLPFGGAAHRALARADEVFIVPPSLSSVEAAALHITYQTAWIGLHRRAGLQPGETVLVHAAAGGTGAAAVQVAKAADATVIATAGGPEKVARARALGADLVLDYRTDDFVPAVLEATGGRGADVVVDPVGGETFERSTRCIAWEGRILVLGAASGDYAPARTNHVMVKNYSVVGLHWGGYRTRAPEIVEQAHRAIMELHRRGAIDPGVTETVAFSDLPDALTRLAAGKTTGKLVLTPQNPRPCDLPR